MSYQEINIHHARKGIAKTLNTFFDKSMEAEFIRKLPDFEKRKKEVIENILHADEYKHLVELKSHVNLLKYKLQKKNETSQH